MKVIVVISCMLIASCSAKQIQFENCEGTDSVQRVEVVPCEKEPCIFKKGTKAEMTAIGVIPADADDGKLTVTIDLGGVPVPYPGIDSNVCNKVKCPVKKGQPFNIKYEIDVADYFPEMVTTMKWDVVASNGKRILCAKARVGIED